MRGGGMRRIKSLLASLSFILLLLMMLGPERDFRRAGCKPNVRLELAQGLPEALCTRR
jgi:hypothetical protein